MSHAGNRRRGGRTSGVIDARRRPGIDGSRVSPHFAPNRRLYGQTLLIRVNDRIIAFAEEQKELFSSQREQIRGSVLSIMKGDNENWSVRSAILLEYVCGPGDVEIVHRLLKASSHEIVQEAMLASLRLSVEERTTIRPDLMKILASLPSKNPFLFQRVLYRIRDDLGLKPENETDMETYQRVLDAIQKQ